MKLICLNTWAGHEYDALMKFIGDHKADTDIFCFQEMCYSDGPKVSRGTRTNIMGDMERALEGFNSVFSEIDSGFDEVGVVNFDITWGQATFVRKGMTVSDSGSITIHEGDEAHRDEFDYRCVLQYVTLEIEERTLSICNVHGTPRPGTKLDTPARLLQSERVKAYLHTLQDSVILCGDFNLLPKTESIRMLEENLENLIITHAIKTTRGSLNPYAGTQQQQDFADYMFTSKDIHIEQFSVPDARVSDHLPLILHFSLTSGHA